MMEAHALRLLLTLSLASLFLANAFPVPNRPLPKAVAAAKAVLAKVYGLTKQPNAPTNAGIFIYCFRLLQGTVDKLNQAQELGRDPKILVAAGDVQKCIDAAKGITTPAAKGDVLGALNNVLQLAHQAYNYQG